MKSLHLKSGRDKSLKRRHPWIFSGAVGKVDGAPANGETVLVKSAEGQPVALAAWSPQSQICARVWSFDCSVFVDGKFFQEKIKRAVALRSSLPAFHHTNALRLVHGESDGLPGLIVDRYADVLVAQFLSAGAEHWREAILDALVEATGCEAIYERSDAEVRQLEGLPPRAGFARGNREATRCPIVEHGLHFRVDVEAGQKTGFFLDQRDNRQRVRALAQGREVLDAFCYTGGFSVAALAGGAAGVTAVDSSAPALEVARENVNANSMDPAKISFEQADVFAYLRLLRDRGRQLRPGGTRPAQVRAHRGAGEERRARLQGHQPDGVEAARPRRAAGDVFLLGRRFRGTVPVHRRRRGVGCRRGGEDHRALRPRRRPPGGAKLSRGRLPERPARSQGMTLPG